MQTFYRSNLGVKLNLRNLNWLLSEFIVSVNISKKITVDRCIIANKFSTKFFESQFLKGCMFRCSIILKKDTYG